jgi:hypothetical protein
MLDKWHTEVEYFITHHIRPSLKRRQQLLLDRERAFISDKISRRVADAAEKRPAPSVLPARTTPVEFEVFCGEALSARGWRVRLTPQGRDQGVDVIAEKNNVRVVLQCKLYSNPVGNKAVQEVAAGRVHQHAQYGAVVTNSTFTQSAWELAATNGIYLLHHTDLARLEQIVGSDTLIRRFEHGMPEHLRTAIQSTQPESEVTKAVAKDTDFRFEDYEETIESTPPNHNPVDESQFVDNANRTQPKDRRHLIWGIVCIFGATGLCVMMSRISSVPSRPRTSKSTATPSKRPPILRSPSVGLRPADPSAPPTAMSLKPSNTGVADNSSASGDAAKVSVYTSECNSGKMESCTNLGTYYRMGWGVTRDLSRARLLYKKGCDGGDANGCVQLRLFETP